MKVAALYIDPRGPYPKLLGPEMCWDEARDARTYAGPWPVIAHPPCGPWGAWAHLCFKQDKEAFAVALAAVNRWGGVIEHPAKSKAFAHHGIAPTVEIDQCDWGFPARKRTWLFIRPHRILSPEDFPPTGVPTRTLVNRKYNPGLPGLHSRNRSLTPVAFARWLIALASQARCP